MKTSHVLVIRADRSMRIAKKPRIAWDEIGIRLNVNFPPGWGTVVGSIDVTVPPFNPQIETDGAADVSE